VGRAGAGLPRGRDNDHAAGLKPIPLYANAQDSQLADVLKMSDQHIALVFRVPLQILGIGGTPFASTEALMQSWKASGLGFALNHIEEAFGQLFGFSGQPEEYVEFDTQALLRSSRKELIEALGGGRSRRPDRPERGPRAGPEASITASSCRAAAGLAASAAKGFT
jgi:phage portal protein BeeE